MANKIKSFFGKLKLKNIKKIFSRESLRKFRHTPGVVYIILMILFTVVLIADLIIYAVVSPVSSRNGMSMEFSSVGDMSVGTFDITAFDDNLASELSGDDASTDVGTENTSEDDGSESFSGEMPSGMTMPSGDGSEMSGEMGMVSGDGSESFSGEMPSDMTMPSGEDTDFEVSTDDATLSEAGDAIGSFDSGLNMQEMDFTNLETANGGSNNAFLQAVRGHWLIILIVCVLGDLICALLLRRKRRLMRAALEPPVELTEEEMEAAAQERKKRQRKLWAIPICVVLILTLVVASLPTTGLTTDTVTVNEQVLSGTAESGTILTTLSGAGTLSEQETVTISVPDVVTVQTYYVENGDTVSAGDVLAYVDKDSVGVALAELQAVIEELDEALAEEADETPDEEITAVSAGRVKVIYAEEDTSVTDIVYNYGALMLLSLDGLMSVQIECDEDFSVDDSVTVELSDGTVETGRVAAISVSTGMITVTISDETAIYQDSVIVYDEDGNVLGSGTLNIHSELKIMGYYGTVSDIEVSLNEAVDAGDTLITLEDVGHTATYTALLNRRYELEEQMTSLSILYIDGYVYAECDGVISGISDDATISSLASADSYVSNAAVILDSESYIAGNLTSSESGTLMLLANEPMEIDEDTQMINYVGEITALDFENGCIVLDSYKRQVAIDDYKDLDDVASLKLTEIITVEYGDLETFSYYDSENDEWIAKEISELEVGDRLVLTYRYVAAVTDGNGNVLDDAYYALAWLIRVDAESDDEAVLPENPDGSEGIESTGGEQMSESQENDEESNADESQTMESTDTEGDDQQNMTGTGTTIAGMTSGGSAASAGTASSGSVSGMTAEETYAYETYSIAEKDVLTITPQESMTISVSVDELDILSLETGLSVEVTLDAIKGQSFDGIISSIGTTGTNSGGNTKYTVEITLDRTSQMLDGMNASIKVVTDTTESEVTIPVAALVEEDGKTYVYTTYDEKTDTLSGMVEVETGVADESTVEILSGLESGDTYYYRYAESLTYNFLSAFK